ncbi:acyl-CoA dehydratase activase [Anaeromyxobacter oryzae]|uniref:2-hydroxyglutaryl-CoA dehydratase n=1 Tax=Anaeromyxobacter oryzae TaxID=2918170 RepID=A0ABN6MVU4_9BACT|nr:acyl-CoA dehydratase activase [Anaeromyxobacter oryzae]BDG05097.1 2-hydroxyglutaryl-CoA dehydratase [Anaeromyxobacter oryzae]
MSAPVAIGVDVGSTTCKAVAIDAAGALLARRVEPTDPRIERQVQRLVGALRETAPGDLPIGATGYGRKRVPGARALTEITCHARGAFARTGRPGVLVDMGGQDTKVIRIGAAGEVVDFSMNDKCAAGTGRFLEVILGRLQVPLEGLAERVARAPRAVPVSSTCTVFAESEVISLVASDEPLDGIVKGLHVSLASRVASLARGMQDRGEVLMSGGVALNGAMVAALQEALGRPVRVLPDPQLIGALGAALSVAPGR